MNSARFLSVARIRTCESVYGTQRTGASGRFSQEHDAVEVAWRVSEAAEVHRRFTPELRPVVYHMRDQMSERIRARPSARVVVFNYLRHRLVGEGIAERLQRRGVRHAPLMERFE